MPTRAGTRAVLMDTHAGRIHGQQQFDQIGVGVIGAESGDARDRGEYLCVGAIGGPTQMSLGH
ncbi:hypothetical protein MSAR_44460 [Mycolicibacterium sarraceniae]|uniref:Uncharacterized protein n=1 Tax=Mycolicibacterium sarraceniae TaxID=1534348 RepID=A0A7I7SXH9_9MYCO|nr:hypothetical protein MSAR_44460 [Mycolicibacterium sarraceniae]